MVNLAGPLIGGFVFAAKGWRWTQWVTLLLALAAYLLGIGIPETYPRAIMTRRAKRRGLPPPKLMEAGSGVTLKDMVQVTFLTPLKMLRTEPIVAGASLYLGFDFAVIFSFFISIPVVLESTYGFDIQQVGLAFIAAIVGSFLAAATSVSIDRLMYPKLLKKSHNGMVDVEYRLYPAMIGGFGITISLFWIAWTASPVIRWPSPVFGTLLYVWGNMSVLVSKLVPSFRQDEFLTQVQPFVSDLCSFLSFRRLPSQGNSVGAHSGRLSAINARRCTPACNTTKSVFHQFQELSDQTKLTEALYKVFTGLTGAWALSLLGFISTVLLPLPWMLFKWGPTLRARSKYSHEKKGVEKPDAGRMNPAMTHSMGDVSART